MSLSNHLRISLFCYIIVLLLQACSTEHTDQNLRLGWVEGQVTDSLSDNPIDSAIISLADTLIAGDTNYTDTTGSYLAFAGALGPNRSVFCRKAGYQPRKKMVDLLQDTTRIDFKMVP